jgi:hypothetical protein
MCVARYLTNVWTTMDTLNVLKTTTTHKARDREQVLVPVLTTYEKLGGGGGGDTTEACIACHREG